MKLVVDQGIDVVAINIDTGFGSTKDRLAHMQSMCDQIGAKLEVLDLKQEFLDEVLFEPKYGYGKNFNPCIDCHGFMFRHTSKLLERFGADFMISGEVMGQRPMSQRKDAMIQVGKLSDGHEELILRPLCAKLLPPTKPEIEGWIDRDRLLDISGRSRKSQLALASEIGLEGFEDPAGGCLLTEITFSNRLKEFIKHDELETADIQTLKFGRHLRLPDGAKLIIGRDKQDNENIKSTNSSKYDQVRVTDATGPLSLLSKNTSSSDMSLAMQIILTYAKTESNKTYNLKVGEANYSATKLESKEECAKFFVNYYSTGK
jgi:tRNA-specific 2-thiouridylase